MNIFYDADDFVNLDNRHNRNLYKTSIESLYNKTEAQLPKDLIEGKTILDLGSCLSHAGYYALLNGAKFYTGVEVQPGYADLADKLLNKYTQGKNFEVIQQDINDFLDECIASKKKFDIVLAAGIIYGFFDPIVFLTKMTKVANETIVIDSKFVPSSQNPDVGVMVIIKNELMPNGSDNENSHTGVGVRMCPKAIDIVMESQGFKRQGDFILPNPIADAHDPYNETKTYPSGVVGPYKFISRYQKVEESIPILEDVIKQKSLEKFLLKQEKVDHNPMLNYSYFYDPNSSSNNLSVKFRHVTREVADLKTECINTAKYIQEQANGKPIYIAFSGGLDSEIVCRSFIEAGVPFTAFTLKYAKGLNVHDTWYAEKFCDAFKIPLHIEELDVYKFFNDGIEKYIEQGYYANKIFRYFLIYILEKINDMGGVCVGGGGETHYVFHENQLCTPFKADTLIPLQWIENHGLHFMEFFRTTPEISAAYHQDELIKFLSKDPTYFLNPDVRLFQPEKVMLYHRLFPNMKRRQKFIGMEQILELKAEVEARLDARFKDKNLTQIFVPVTTIKKQLGIL